MMQVLLLSGKMWWRVTKLKQKPLIPNNLGILTVQQVPVSKGWAAQKTTIRLNHL